MLAWLMLLVCVRMVQGYDTGLVSGSCGDMTPSHRGNSAQNSQAPYSISTDTSSYIDGQEITVTLAAQSGSFKGFLLEAREVGGSNPVGSFTLVSSNTQLLPCSSQANAAVSHTSASSKSQIQSKWKAPSSGNSKNIEFRATVVRDFSTFWVGVKSAAVTYSGPKVPVDSASSGSSTQSPANSGSSTISNSGCGSTKTCFSNPSSCDPSSNSNCYFMSATPSASGAPYKFEIVGGADGYVSIGFSDDKEMGNDDIYICGKDSNGNIQLQHAFSTGTTTPGNIALGNVSGFSSSLTNGVISCSFTSANTISTTRSSSSQNSYYIFLAYGATKSGVIQMHSTTPFISSSKVDLSSVTSLGSGEVFPPIVKAHGCLMLIAWMTTGSIGMLIARYLKKAAKGTKPCGKDFWFVTHVFLMILSVAATIIAFILVFSYAQDWAGGAHPVLGLIVMILSLVQPIAAMFRCGPQDERRYIFNWAHTINALAIKALAVAAIFTGLALVDTSDQQWLPKVMGGFVAWEAICFLFQDFHQRRKKKDVMQQDSDRARTESLLLVMFFLGNIAFLVALLVGIGNA
ncbi:putative ferric-chelate reductase 1 [Colossoma macropomum]|uniref:putative ferric-chelate reductase 1 n=1 Tax=Colossoma macropomum TaxID=42526 RepID=UPI001864F304|nr:putative ferric-chelate reductase 1 [Colossoma macropomum]